MVSVLPHLTLKVKKEKEKRSNWQTNFKIYWHMFCRADDEMRGGNTIAEEERAASIKADVITLESP